MPLAPLLFTLKPNRRHCLCCCLALVLLLVGCEEKKSGIYRVGILSGLHAFSAVSLGFKDGMKELGYIEGKDITYDLRESNADSAESQRILRQFVADQVDLILVYPTEPAVEAKSATSKSGTPVIFCNAGIEWNNLVNNVRQPGKNLTGVRFPGPDLVVKRLEILIELAPRVKRLYVPYDPNYPNNAPALEMLRKAASSKGISLLEAPVSSAKAIRDDLEAKAKSEDIRIDAIQIMPETLTQSPAGWALITEFAAKHKLPIVGAAPFSARKGAVFSLAPDPYEIGRLAAPMADKILRGILPGTIPVATPEAHLRLNCTLARELGLKIPTGILKMAHEVYR